jgi:hypothetical protein
MNFVAVQTAIRAVLIGASAVTDLVPAQNIHDSRDDKDPQIVIGEDQILEGDDIARLSNRIVSTLHVWKQEASTVGVKEIASAIAAVLHSTRPAPDGFHCGDCRVVGARFLRDPDGVTSHGVVTIETLISRTAAPAVSPVNWVDVHGMEYPRRVDFVPNSPVLGSVLINATGQKIAAMGRVWHRFAGPKQIERVWWRLHTIVKAGGSALVTSLQDVNLAAGPPQQPDGTIDQSVALLNAAIATGMNRSGVLSAKRAVSRGDLMSMVLEFDGAGRLGSDSIAIQTLQLPGSSSRSLDNTVSRYDGSAWVNQSSQPYNLLEFDDGTFGCLGAWPMNGVAAVAFNSGSTPDERGARIEVPAPMRILGIALPHQVAAGGDAEVVLYDDADQVLAVATIDGSAVEVLGQARRVEAIFPDDVLLKPGRGYRVTVKPTTGNSVTVFEYSVTDAAHWQAWPGPTSWQLTTRADGGAWTDTPTTRPAVSLLVSQMLMPSTAAMSEVA